MDNPAFEHMQAHADVFQCPYCGGDFLVDMEVRCHECRAAFPVDEGIPRLFAPNDWDQAKGDVTETIRAFYEETPFPNYDGFETVADLVQRAERGMFARLLNEQLPFSIRVLEVGCGTGQLSNYLGIAHRFVFGTDMTMNSLKLAQAFKAANGLKRVGFYQMNLFRPVFKPESFDVVICNGVLHHTSDPYGGFRSIARLVKRNGHILVGLYNRYGRFSTDVRRVLFRRFGAGLRFLDPRFSAPGVGGTKKAAWFEDQYHNPHESKHTMGELLRWFEREGFEFTYGWPAPKAFAGFNPDDRIFEPHPAGGRLDHLLAQLAFLFRGSREGGLFLMIGRKR